MTFLEFKDKMFDLATALCMGLAQYGGGGKNQSRTRYFVMFPKCTIFAA